MDDEPRERHLNIHFSPEIMAGVYANFANVSHSDYEFTVTFARVDHEVDDVEVPGVVVTRVNLSPRFMRELIDAMEDNYSKWSTREGIASCPSSARARRSAAGMPRAPARTTGRRRTRRTSRVRATRPTSDVRSGADPVRVAVFSDVHANLAALEAVLVEIDAAVGRRDLVPR